MSQDSTCYELEQVKAYLCALQNKLCQTISEEDGGQVFAIDDWQSASDFAGYGSTRILERGDVFEKAGVNFSCVTASSLPTAATVQRQHLAGTSVCSGGCFTGVSSHQFPIFRRCMLTCAFLRPPMMILCGGSVVVWT